MISAPSLPFSRSAAWTIAFESAPAPASTIAVCPSREIDTPGVGATTVLTARSARSVCWARAIAPRNDGSLTVLVCELITVIRP